MFFRTFTGAAVLAAGLAGAARADVPLGLWQAAPDSSGLVVHVRTRACGRGLCGRVERAKDRRGYDTPSRAVGHRMLWDLEQAGDGSFVGHLLPPGSSSLRTARLRVQGNVMQVESCDGAGCRAEVWTRLR